MAKLIQNGAWGPQNGVIGVQNAPGGATWTLGAPRCANREVKVPQDGPKRGPKEPLGTPRGAQGSPRGPRMSPKGAQGKPKVSPRGSKGAKVDAQEGQNTTKMIVQNHKKTMVLIAKTKIWRPILSSEGFMLAHDEQSGFILVRVGSKWGHGASWWRHHGSSWSIFGVHGVSWRALGDTMGTSMELQSL